VATVGPDKSVQIRDRRSWRILRSLRNSGGVYWPAFSPDGRHILTFGGVTPRDGRSKTARVWDLTNGRLLYTLPINAFGAEFGPRGKLIVTYDSAATHIWDATNGHLLRTLHA
jgi:WD40 repeat protein